MNEFGDFEFIRPGKRNMLTNERTTSIEFTVSSDSSAEELIHEFKLFMQACGYSFGAQETLQITEETLL